jgi:hypothetical protein
MTPEERDLINGLTDGLKNAGPAAKDAEAGQPIRGADAGADPGDEPGLGVDWGSNIEPGPGPDPGAVEPRRGSDGGYRAV